MGNKSKLRDVDALDLLTRDHDSIRQLFRYYERLMKRPVDPERQAEIVGQICFELSLHMKIEEEVFFPAVRAAMRANIGAAILADIGTERRTNLGWNVLINDALFDAACGHSRAKALIARLDEMEPGDADYDGTIDVLRIDVSAHMNDEQEHLFPKVRVAQLDTASLGRKIAQRRRALHEDVTRIGLPRSTDDVGVWPVACRVARTVDAVMPGWTDF